jgi:hypothetical protein
LNTCGWSEVSFDENDDETTGKPMAMGITGETILAFEPDHWTVRRAGPESQEAHLATYFEPLSGKTSSPLHVQSTADGHWKCDPGDFIRDGGMVKLQKE